MDKKKIDLSKSVFELCKEDEAVISIMQEAGFHDIANPKMLQTVGRFMTIPKGAQMKKIPLDTIKELFRSHGYEVE